MSDFNFYPDQLRQIAAIIDALDKAEQTVEFGQGMTLMLQQDIEVQTEDGVMVGHLRDEIGGSWSFTTAEGQETT